MFWAGKQWDRGRGIETTWYFQGVKPRASEWKLQCHLKGELLPTPSRKEKASCPAPALLMPISPYLRLAAALPIGGASVAAVLAQQVGALGSRSVFLHQQARGWAREGAFLLGKIHLRDGKEAGAPLGEWFLHAAASGHSGQRGGLCPEAPGSSRGCGSRAGRLALQRCVRAPRGTAPR